MTSDVKEAFLAEVTKFGLRAVIICKGDQIDPMWLSELNLKEVVGVCKSLLDVKRALIRSLIFKMTLPKLSSTKIGLHLLEDLYRLAERSDVVDEICRRDKSSAITYFDLINAHLDDGEDERRERVNKRLYNFAMCQTRDFSAKIFKVLCRLNENYRRVIEKYGRGNDVVFYQACLIRARTVKDLQRIQHGCSQDEKLKEQWHTRYLSVAGPYQYARMLDNGNMADVSTVLKWLVGNSEYADNAQVAAYVASKMNRHDNIVDFFGQAEIDRLSETKLYRACRKAILRFNYGDKVPKMLWKPSDRKLFLRLAIYNSQVEKYFNWMVKNLGAGELLEFLGEMKFDCQQCLMYLPLPFVTGYHLDILNLSGILRSVIDNHPNKAGLFDKFVGVVLNTNLGDKAEEFWQKYQQLNVMMYLYKQILRAELHRGKVVYNMYYAINRQCAVADGNLASSMIKIMIDEVLQLDNETQLASALAGFDRMNSEKQVALYEMGSIDILNRIWDLQRGTNQNRIEGIFDILEKHHLINRTYLVREVMRLAKMTN